MKSSHNSSASEWVKQLFRSFLEMLVRPAKVADRIAKMKPDLLAALTVVVMSGALLTLGAFIAGGVALEVYQYQISSFLIELLTTPFPSPASITSLDYGIVFLKDVLFFVKVWLLFSVLLFLFLEAFRERVRLMDALVLSAWTVSPWALIGFLFGPTSFLVKLGFPSLYQYVFIFALGVLGLVVAPAVFIRALTVSRQIPVYKVSVSYLLSMFALYVIFTLNHPDILFFIVG